MHASAVAHPPALRYPPGPMATPNRLQALIHNPHAPIAEVAALLDPLAFGARWAQLAVLSRDDQRALYRKAAGSPPTTLEDFVPADLAPRIEVIHRGRNTLPAPEPIRFFEKRFCRPASGGDRLFGYNEGLTRRFVGPGYFITRSTQALPGGRPTERADWAERGAIVIDYYDVPDGAVVPGWPRVVPNDHGVQRFVYRHTRDFMRRVSKHVTIGAAFKGEAALDHYFVLCAQGMH